jgi:hypothetical protein
MAERLPNFIYIGPDKAGSTWIYDVLSWHPDVFMSSAKDIGFFDQHFSRGPEWYRRRFADADDEEIVGEASHNYLYSSKAPERIERILGDDICLMVNLREPAKRAFSSYLHFRKHGLFDGPFEEALQEIDELVDHGRYATYVSNYFEVFDRDQVLVTMFDDLKDDAAAFAEDLFASLGLGRREIPEELQGKSLPASEPRLKVVSQIVKYGAMAARKMGLVELIGQIKRSRLVQRLLYRPLDEEEKPRPDDETMNRLRDEFHEEVLRLDELVEHDVAERWGYS